MIVAAYVRHTRPEQAWINLLAYSQVLRSRSDDTVIRIGQPRTGRSAGFYLD